MERENRIYELNLDLQSISMEYEKSYHRLEKYQKQLVEATYMVKSYEDDIRNLNNRREEIEKQLYFLENKDL